MSRGYVYILTNEAMPGLVKIGMTTGSPQARAAQLYQTGVPFPFKVAAEFASPDCAELEAMAHQLLADCRVNEGREFFLCEVHKAESKVENAHREQVEFWLDQFMPDHTIAHVDEYVDLGSFRGCFYDAISSSGLHPPEVVEALHEITGEEIGPAITRQKEAASKRRSAYLARQGSEDQPS